MKTYFSWVQTWMEDNCMHSDILPVLQEILLTLVEIKVAIHKYDPPSGQQEEWLTAQQAMEFLYIEKRTFYRRRNEEQGKWVTKKVGKRLLYLKSSLY
ncbi:hypothetical protein [Pedobacter nutrimenti]|uniref:hypothetical protein n=1 Tax=Pedobacter nutrimenti TaxID=1241337 RepID=UPI002931F373|nr:hypothetical protein [Pedobacter nutrimenti]